MRILIGLLIVILISSQSFAHPGRTDANGGHYNRKTGGYHYHGGGHSSSSNSYSKPSTTYRSDYSNPSVTTKPSYSKPTVTRDKNGRIKRSSKVKYKYMKMTGYPKGRPGYVVDHITPLACGGSDDPSNMQWQTTREAKEKDKWERQGCQ